MTVQQAATDDLVPYAARVLTRRWHVASDAAFNAIREVAAVHEMDVRDLAALVAIAPAGRST